MNQKFIIRSVVVLLITLASVWFALDDHRVVQTIKSIFGDGILMYLVPVFYCMFMIGLITWMVRPLCSGSSNRKCDRKGGHVLATLTLISIFVWSQQYALAHDSSGVITKTTVVSPNVLAGQTTTLADGVYTGTELGLACGVAIVVVVIVIAGIVYVTFKLVKACNKIRDMKKKQDKDGDEDSKITLFPSAQSLHKGLQNIVTDRTEYAALFVASTPFTAEDATDCGCTPPFNVRYLASGMNNDQVSAYVPQPADLIECSQYLESHGLSTNLVNSYSVNSQPTNDLPQISMNNDMVVVNLGLPNQTHIFQYSDDMTNWMTMGTLSAPTNAVIKFSDSWHTRQAERGFWRVIRTD